MRKISPLDASNLFFQLFQEQLEKSMYSLKKHLIIKKLYNQYKNLKRSTLIVQKKDP